MHEEDVLAKVGHMQHKRASDIPWRCVTGSRLHNAQKLLHSEQASRQAGKWSAWEKEQLQKDREEGERRR